MGNFILCGLPWAHEIPGESDVTGYLVRPLVARICVVTAWCGLILKPTRAVLYSLVHCSAAVYLFSGLIGLLAIG